MDVPKPVDSLQLDVAHIGKSVAIKGELSGSEDLYVDGEVEGSIELPGHSLVVGPNGRIRSSINARNVIVHGKVDGDIAAKERVELRKSAILVGNIATQRLAIEDGAYFKGGIEIQREMPKAKTPEQPKAEPAREPAQAMAAPATSAVATGQGAPLEAKK